MLNLKPKIFFCHPISLKSSLNCFCEVYSPFHRWRHTPLICVEPNRQTLVSREKLAPKACGLSRSCEQRSFVRLLVTHALSIKSVRLIHQQCLSAERTPRSWSQGWFTLLVWSLVLCLWSTQEGAKWCTCHWMWWRIVCWLLLCFLVPLPNLVDPNISSIWCYFHVQHLARYQPDGSEFSLWLTSLSLCTPLCLVTNYY